MTHEEKVAYRCAILQGATAALHLRHVTADDLPMLARAHAYFAMRVVDEMEQLEAPKP